MGESRKKDTFSPGVQKPSEDKGATRQRLITALVLTFVLPPVGLVLLWRDGMFKQRGRMILTGIAVVEMAFLMTLILPSRGLVSDVPVPAIPASVTVAPQGDVVSALDNIDELLAQQQKEQAAAAGAEITPEPTDRAAYDAEQQAILDTIVYSVYGNSAKYYHSVEICGTQTNRRALTVREAMNQGMGACPNCSPPVYIG